MREREEQTEQTLYFLGWIFIGVFIAGFMTIKCFPDIVNYISFPCIFNKITGYYCPGCGGTRAVKFFVTGHWVKSFICHPVVPYVGIGGGIYMLTHTLFYITKGRIKGMKFRLGYVYIMGVIIGLQFIIKNIMIYIWKFHII